MDITIGFNYVDVSSYVTKNTETSIKAQVNSKRVVAGGKTFNYWVRAVDIAGVEQGYRYVDKYGANLSMVNSNTKKGSMYKAQAHREYPLESGYVSGTWQP